MWHEWKSFLLAAFLLALAIVVIFYPLVLQNHVLIQHDLHISDLNNFALPFRSYLGNELWRGNFPQWVPSALCGVPTIANIQLGACYPLNWLCYGLLPLPIGHNLYILLTFFIAGLGMYLLCRQWNYAEDAALIGGLAFCFCGFLCCHIRHLAMISTACWLPLSVAIIEWALRKERAQLLLFLSFSFALQQLAGHPQITYYSGLFYCLYLAGRLWSERETKVGFTKILAWFVLALLLGTLLASVQLLPTWELSKLWWRSGGVTYKEATAFPYYLKDLIHFVYPGFNGDPGNCTYRPRSSFYENYGYLGLLPFLFALVATASALWSKKKERLFVFLGLFSFLIILGPHTPVFSLFFHTIPGLALFRHPTRCMLLLNFCLALLAAMAWNGLRCYFAPSKRKLLGLLLFVIVLGDLFYFQRRRLPSVEAKKWLAPPVTAQYLKKQVGSHRYYTLDSSVTHLAAFRVATGWWGNLYPYIAQRDFLQPSINVLFGVSSADGYVNMAPKEVTSIWGYSSGRLGLVHKLYERVGQSTQPKALRLKNEFIKLMSLFNVKYFISLLPLQSPHVEEIKIASGAKLYRNKRVKERVFLAHRYFVIKDEKEQLQRLLAPTFNIDKEIVLATPVAEMAPGLEQSLHTEGKSNASITGESDSEVNVQVNMAQRGFLVLSDNHYPGWKVYVNGQEKSLLKANVTQRAVYLPSGKHKVKFVFSSKTVKIGLAITLFTLLITVGLLANYVLLDKEVGR